MGGSIWPNQILILVRNRCWLGHHDQKMHCWLLPGNESWGVWVRHHAENQYSEPDRELCQRGDTGLPWGTPYRGRILIWDYPKGNQAIRTPSPVQGLTGDPGELTPVLGLASDCSTQSDWAGACRIPPGFTIRGTELEEKKALLSPGKGEWCSKHDTGQFFPPITCYPTHGKRLAQCGDCRILRKVFCSAQPAALQVLPRRQDSDWSEPSPPGGFTTWSRKGVLGTLGTYPGRGLKTTWE